MKNKSPKELSARLVVLVFFERSNQNFGSQCFDLWLMNTRKIKIIVENSQKDHLFKVCHKRAAENLSIISQKEA